VHDAPTLEFPGRIEESVRGDEVDARMVIPAGQESLQHTSSRGFSDRDRTGDADDEGHLTVGMLLAEEGRGGREQSLACRYL
jgi:hypothetical protein